MKTNRLFNIAKIYYKIEEVEQILKDSTIFDKIEFSGISKEKIQAKITDLETRQVPSRDVLLNMTDNDVAEYWFKNWLHPALKYAVPPSPRDKQGCSKAVLERDMRQDFLRMYENGQQNFNYTLDDIKNWLKGKIL